MTGIDRRGDTPMGPPWPVDVLADLHAGVYEPAVSDELWPRVRHDPGALGVLDALDATRAELGGLPAAPAPRMPEHFASRLDAAMAAEAQAMFPAPRAPQEPRQAAPVVDLARARARRTKRLGWSVGALVAAAAAAVVVIAIPHGGSPVTGIAAAPPTTAGGNPNAGGPPEALTGGQLGSTALAAAIGRTDYGPLRDPAKRAACLEANHLDPNQTPAGAMQITLDGKPGTLIVLTTGQTAQYRLLVVGPDCAAGHADQLADTVVGGVPPTTR